MAILGNGGIIEISREIPRPRALTAARVNLGSAPYSISMLDRGFWTGDRVSISSSDGLPFDINGDGFADCPGGHAEYFGSKWELGPNRSFYTGNLIDGAPAYDQFTDTLTLIAQNDDFLITQDDNNIVGVTGIEDNIAVYNKTSTTGKTTVLDAYIHRDELDRITFYSTEASAYAGTSTNRIDIKKVDFGNFVIAAYNSDSGYTAAMNSAASSINGLTLSSPDQPLNAVISLPALFGTLCESNRQWVTQCGLREWVMSIDASNLDTTAIGETFGDHVKALVRGAGSLNFLVEHELVANQQDSLAMLRLVLLTQNQCDTKAKFYIYKNRSGGSPEIDGSVYYECDILLTNSSLNVRYDDLITGTADFVATSEVKLMVVA